MNLAQRLKLLTSLVILSDGGRDAGTPFNSGELGRRIPDGKPILTPHHVGEILKNFTFFHTVHDKKTLPPYVPLQGKYRCKNEQVVAPNNPEFVKLWCSIRGSETTPLPFRLRREKEFRRPAQDIYRSQNESRSRMEMYAKKERAMRAQFQQKTRLDRLRERRVEEAKRLAAERDALRKELEALQLARVKLQREAERHRHIRKQARTFGRQKRRFIHANLAVDAHRRKIIKEKLRREARMKSRKRLELAKLKETRTHLRKSHAVEREKLKTLRVISSAAR